MCDLNENVKHMLRIALKYTETYFPVRNAAHSILEKVHFHQICIDACNSQKCNDLRFIFTHHWKFLNHLMLYGNLDWHCILKLTTTLYY